MDRYPSAISSLLIRDVKTNNDFTELAIPIMAYRIKFLLVSLIRPDTEEFEELELTVKEFMEYFEIKSWGGNQQDALSDAISMMKSFNYIVENNPITWLTGDSDVEGQNIRLCLHESLTPYLLNLKRNFTKIYYENIKNIKSMYSLRLYELLESMKGVGSYKITLKNAYRTICDDRYTTKSEFVAHVVEPAVEEINNYTDLNVTYRFEKSFGVPEKIIFEIGNSKKISKKPTAPSVPKPSPVPKPAVKSKGISDPDLIDIRATIVENNDTDDTDELPF